MKAYIFTIFMLYNLLSPSQPYLGPIIGQSSLHPVGGLIVGYQFKEYQESPYKFYRAISNFSIEGEIVGHLDHINPGYLCGTIGYNIQLPNLLITTMAGTAFRIKSFDNPEQNSFVFDTGVRFDKEDYYIQYNYRNTHFVTVGWRGVL